MTTQEISQSAAAAAYDPEKGNSKMQPGALVLAQADDGLVIEHVYVENDPREWSRSKKIFVLILVSVASSIAGFGANIYNSAVMEVQSDLHTTASLVAVSLSVPIVVQGGAPVLWCAVSEIIGRKVIYILSLAIAVVGSVISGIAKNIGLFIGMRCLQAAGVASAISIGAATLADIYEPHERGFIMGIYYCAPLIGVSVGPLIGGALTDGLGWRSTLYFTAIFSGVCMLSFFLFEDTFRKERSAVYVDAIRRRRKMLHQALEQALFDSRETVVARGREKVEIEASETTSASGQASEVFSQIAHVPRTTAALPDDAKTELGDVHLTLLDVNPIGPMLLVLCRLNNTIIITASGVFYGFAFSIAYSCSIILGDTYHYSPILIGVVLLAYGVRCVLGSVLGGKWSDRVFRMVKEKHGSKSEPEMRLLAACQLMAFLPPSVVAYGWTIEKHVNIATVCVFLFLSGFFSISIYSSTLAYIVDSNVGRSSSAIALNTLSRGIFGLVAAEIVVPLQNSIGEGGLYSLWAGWLLISELMILLVWWKGSAWRKRGEERDARDAAKYAT